MLPVLPPDLFRHSWLLFRPFSLWPKSSPHFFGLRFWKQMSERFLSISLIQVNKAMGLIGDKDWESGKL